MEQFSIKVFAFNVGPPVLHQVNRSTTLNLNLPI